jgi:hypothetical protein
MDKRIPKGKIISALRKLTFSHKERTAAKNRNKVDKATYECELCGAYCYDGKSESSYQKLVDKYPKKVVKYKYTLDHIEPIIPIVKGWKWDWNEYIDRMFCAKEDYQGICVDCHDEKTEQENKLRQELKKK